MTVVSYYMLGAEVPKPLGLNAWAVIGFIIAIQIKIRILSYIILR